MTRKRFNQNLKHGDGLTDAKKTTTVEKLMSNNFQKKISQIAHRYTIWYNGINSGQLGRAYCGSFKHKRTGLEIQ